MTMTQDKLKSILHYNPDTGVFTWIIDSHKAKAGDIISTVNNGYVRPTINNKRYYAHRLAWLYMTGEFPKQIDHIDLNKINNKWENLRLANDSQNNFNKDKTILNTSGFKGVSWYKNANKWRAEIKAYGKRLRIGYFTSIEDAAAAYKEAAKKLHAEYGRTEQGRMA